MRVEEAVQGMTKQYLHRVIDSFTRDLPKLDEERSRDLILRNHSELVAPERIRNVLAFSGTFSEQILLRGILAAMVNAPQHSLDEESLIEKVLEGENQVLEMAGHPDALQYEPQRAVEVLQEVLAVALEDDRLSNDEIRLIRRLREKLGLSERGKHLILARLDHFPQPENRPHSRSDFKEAFLDLQRRGVLFYCNRIDGGKYVVPEEIVVAVRGELGVELSDAAWRQLLAHLSKAHLSTMLEAAGVPKSGTKDELCDRVLAAALKPSKSLDALSNDDLYDICKGLPGAKVSGTKGDRVERIIDYFASLVTKEVGAEASPGEVFYEYLVELATRDRESLLANHVIKKDIDMERAFEEGTRFLMERKLGLELLPMPGSDHPDGMFRLPRSGDLLMWDNKSKESSYDFPESHLKQFKRYIRDSQERVSVFLVIAPEVSPSAEDSALRLKVDSGQDTDVALVSAENLKWVAENWGSFSRSGKFDPEVFNHTGVLDRRVLEQRLKLFLG